MDYLVPSSRPEDWRRFLADPGMHWVRGRSTWEVAHSWEMANGFPDPVLKLLEESDVPVLQGLEIIDAQPLPVRPRTLPIELAAHSTRSIGGPTVQRHRDRPEPGSAA